MTKSFYVSSNFFFEYDSINTPINLPNPHISRKLILLKASPGVSASDIAQEFKEHYGQYYYSTDNPFLTTCMVEEPGFVVAFGFKPALAILEARSASWSASFDKRVDWFAAQMISLRDLGYYEL